MSGKILLTLIKFLEDTGPVDPDDISSKLIPSLPAFGIQLAAFVVLIVVVVFLAYKPVKKRLAARRELQEGKMKEAEKNLRISKKKIREADEYILDSKKKALKIVEEGKTNSRIQGDEIIKQAEIDAKNMKEKALKEAQAENEKMKEQLYKETVDLSLMAASKLIDKEMDNSTNEKLAKNFIEDLKKDKETK